MINLIEEDVANIRNVGAPITPDEIKEFFVNNKLLFVVNYDSARLRGLSLLTYLANLNIPADIDITGDNVAENYAQIMHAYMTQRMICNSKTLALYCAELILLAKKMPHDEIPFRTGIDKDIAYKFLVDNKDIVLNWIAFLDSFPVFMTSKVAALNRRFNPKKMFANINDKEFVGHNVMNLIGLPSFIDTYNYKTTPFFEPAYYTAQFEERMFANKFMVEFVDSEVSLAPTIYSAIASEVDRVNKPNQVVNVLSKKIRNAANKIKSSKD